MPIAHVAEDLVGTYVKRYAPEIPVPDGIADAVSHVTHLAGDASSALDYAAKHLGGGHGGDQPRRCRRRATSVATGHGGPTLSALGDALKRAAPPSVAAGIGVASNLADVAAHGVAAVRGASEATAQLGHDAARAARPHRAAPAASGVLGRRGGEAMRSPSSHRPYATPRGHDVNFGDKTVVRGAQQKAAGGDQRPGVGTRHLLRDRTGRARVGGRVPRRPRRVGQRRRLRHRA